MYLKGNGVTQDLEQVLYWFGRGVEKGDRDAQNKIDKIKTILTPA